MKRVLTLALFCAVYSGNAAHAQFFGPFMGPFMGPFFAPHVSATQQVQDRKPITLNVGGPIQHRPGDSPNAYWNNLREPIPASYTYAPRSNIRTGNRGIDSATTSRNRQAKPAAMTTKVLPKDHFLGFFSPGGPLVWPVDSPLDGELSGKRATVDEAMTRLKTDLAGTTPPPVASIVGARNELLAYGRPALAYLREHKASRADSFHAWLLDLYNTLGDLAQR